MEVEKLTLPPVNNCIGWLNKSSYGELTLIWIRESRQADKRSCHPGPGPELKLDYPRIYIICELLEHVKGLVPLIQNCRISMTQDNNRITRRNPVLTVSQKPETLNQTNDTLQ